MTKNKKINIRKIIISIGAEMIILTMQFHVTNKNKILTNESTL